jgi:excinuclease ABC subunit A
LIDQTRAGMYSPADFLGLLRPLAALFAQSPGAAAAGLDQDSLARRCSACNGSGVQRLDMGFLPSVSAPCETCRGTGFLPEAWEVTWHARSLPEIVQLTLDEVYDFVSGLQEDAPDQAPGLLRPMEAAREVGLGYLVFNQPGDTLSGGEAQRLKIAGEILQRKGTENTLYILDEPTVGQHLEDVERLAGVLHRLVERGASVLVVEHHTHLLAACDWLIELGPGGGPEGGQVVASGSPETVAHGNTPIASYLREVLEEKR